jgi:hypothetical protein
MKLNSFSEQKKSVSRQHEAENKGQPQESYGMLFVLYAP